MENHILTKKRRRYFYTVCVALAAIVVFCTVYALILPAVALQKKTCDFTVHSHTDDCYDKKGNIICGQADFVVHTHNENCYGTDGTLLCTLPEMKAHTHGKNCYNEQSELVCALPEIRLHSHSKNCYDKEGNLICGQLEVKEHVHGVDCSWMAEEKESEDTTCENGDETGRADTKDNIETTGGDNAGATIDKMNRSAQVKASSASEGEKISTTPVANFRLWLWIKIGNNNASQAANYNAGIVDALKITNEEKSYLIPIKYFTDAYRGFYSFDATNECPFQYAPDAANPNAARENADYVQVGDSWYVKIEDRGTYGSPPRSNIYFNINKHSRKELQNNVNHSNTVINLFDYWTNQKTYQSGSNDRTNRLEEGINKNHSFKFTNGNVGNSNSINNWTGNAAPRYGIVKNNLENGYPVLSGGESLDYLFDPDPNKDNSLYRESHRKVTGLMQIDHDGYYYYNSQWNFAEYNKENNRFTLYNENGVAPGGAGLYGQFFPFNKYDDVAESKSTADQMNHFFGMTMSTRFIQRYDGCTNSSKKTHTTYEFSGDDDVWIFIDGVLVADLGGIHDRASVKIDFATGDVIINAGKGEGIERSTTLYDAFKAAGADTDDFVDIDGDGKLDIFSNNSTHVLKFFYLERGNYDSNLYLKYNLSEIPATAIYKVNQYGDNVEGATFAVYKTDDKYEYCLDDKDEYIKLSEYDYSIDKKTGKITVKDKGTITPKYRGTTDKNGEMIFVDGDNVPYSLKELREMFGGDHFVMREIDIPVGYRIVADEIYFFVENDVLICDNTYESGVWAAPTELVTATDTLYRSDTKEEINYHSYDDSGKSKTNGTLFAVVLKYTGKSDGSEMGNQTKWVPIYGSNKDGYTTVDIKEAGGVMQANIDSAKAAREYGNVLFSMSANGNMQCEMKNLPGDIREYYHMLLDQSQKLGDASLINNTKYTVAFYWTSENSLDKATPENTCRVQSSKAQFRVEGEEISYDGFNYSYGSNIHVPNINSIMLAQKLDEDGNPVNGAIFALYNVYQNGENGPVYYIANKGNYEGEVYHDANKTYCVKLADDQTVSDEKVYIELDTDTDGDNEGTATLFDIDKKNKIGTGTYHIDEKTGFIKVISDNQTYTVIPVDKPGFDFLQVFETGNPADSKMSGEQGGCYFDYLREGSYYLREVGAPKGYKINSKEVPVLVNEDTIYANAGSLNDGVMVSRGTGYVVDTLSEFATIGNVDNSLAWIYTQLKVSESHSFSTIDDVLNWNYASNQFSGGDLSTSEGAMINYLMHSTDPNNVLNNYALNVDKKDGVQSRHLYTDVGWSYLEIYQDYKYGHSQTENSPVKYTDLRGNGDISNLYAHCIHVQVTDEKFSNLEIRKIVDNTKKSDTDSTTTETFEFTLNLLQNGIPLTGSYKYRIYNIDEDGNRRKDTSDNSSGIIENGEGTLILSDSQVVVIEGLPVGATYTVTEKKSAPYFTTAVRNNHRNPATGDANDGIGKKTYSYNMLEECTVSGTLYWEGNENGKVVDNTATVDYTNTYPSDMTIVKVDVDTKRPLAGAEFVFYQKIKGENDYETNYYYHNGSWEKLQGATTLDTVIIPSDDKGEIQLSHIADGSYYLKELKAPSGYHQIADEIKVVIKDGKIDSITPGDKNIKKDGMTLTVPNGTGYELPATGGTGTKLYIYGGLLLMAISLIYGYRMRCRHERRDES